MKIKFTETQLCEAISEVLDESNSCGCPEMLNEELTMDDKKEIKNLIKKEVKDFIGAIGNQDFEAVVTKIVKEKIKGDKELEKHLVEISRNVLVQLYKALWVKRHFWSNSLKNDAN